MPDPEQKPAKALVVVSERDIIFNCPHCSGELVVDMEGTGLEVPCPHCERPLIVPLKTASTVVATAAASDFAGRSTEEIERRLVELGHQLKENRSQDTEMRGHVNRATIELHRLQIKLKKLSERGQAIEVEMESARQALEASSSESA